MRRACHVAVCDFIPPHILEAVAANGDEAQRNAAFLNLETSARMRGERQAMGSMPALLGFLSTGLKRRTVYTAGNERTTPGTRVRGEGDKPTGDLAADEAYDGSGLTYDFYFKNYRRKSIDARGLRLESTVHYGKNFGNAQWNGKQMVYGDGDNRVFGRFTAALDVIGHELTHGVTQNEAGLVYRDQPGALNESFSDIFGILVKQYALKQTAEQADWIVGAGLFLKEIKGVGIRSMKAPGTAYNDPLLGKDPQPGHMKDFVKTERDNGGVHVNSGIPNRAFYETAMILGGNAWETAGSVWYDVLTRKLRPESKFQECADACFASAGELFGRGSKVPKAVAAGWKAVGITVSPFVIPNAPGFHPPSAAAEVP